MSDIRQANGLKNLFSLAIKGVAVIYFILTGEVVWGSALVIAVGAIIGGYGAARFGRTLSQSVTRWTVTAISLAIAAAMFIKLAT